MAKGTKMKFKYGTRRRAIEYEKDIAQYWKKNKTFEKSIEQRSKENSFVFYDGPPFITGAPHYGTLLSSIVKDCIPRYQTMRGKRVERRWGWDCHGLPAENFVEKQLGIVDRRDIGTKISLEEYITKARESMVANSEIWESYIDRIGRWVDFRGAYKTMDKDYMESVWWAFKELYDKSLIYEGEKVLMYDTKFATPVSKNEVTMDNDAYQTVTDPSVYVKFKTRYFQEDTECRAVDYRYKPGTQNDYICYDLTDYIRDLDFPEEINGLMLKNNEFHISLLKVVGDYNLDEKQLAELEKVSKEAGAKMKTTPKLTGEFVHLVDEDRERETIIAILEWEELENWRNEIRKILPDADFTIPHTTLYTAGMPIGYSAKNHDKLFRELDEKIVEILREASEKKRKEKYLLAWTTTPWTLPANTALAVGKDISYSEVKVLENNELYIIASSRVEDTFKGHEFEIIRSDIKGSDLVGLEYEGLFGHVGKIWDADFVEDVGGTGIVHIAPAYGEDDFVLAQENNIPVLHVIDDNGYYLSEFAEKLHKIGVRDTDENGIEVWQANKFIAKCLEEQGKIWKIEYIQHEYPFNPRSGQRIMYRAIPSWFFDIQGQKPMMLEQNENIYWFPTHIKNGRFAKNIEQAPDWNLSRDRFWATAMPVWKGESTNNELRSTNNAFIEVVGSYDELYKLSGENLEDYHRPWVDDIEFDLTVDGETVWDKTDEEKKMSKFAPENLVHYKRIDKVLDCWFESGSMPFAQMHYPFENKTEFEANYPADFIVEYVAQVRAWFYYVHVVNTALADIGAFGDRELDKLPEIKDRDGLVKAAQQIVKKAVELKNKHTDDTSSSVNYACIFCQSDDEYERLVKLVGGFGKEVENHGSGPLFELDESFLTVAGELKLVRIRKYDDQHKDWGDADFTIEKYDEFKKKYHGNDGWDLIVRDFEMLELMEKDFPVRAYFSNPPIDKQLGIKQDGSLRVAAEQKNAFKNCIVTGTIAGEDGRKMSKSLGNYTDPNELMDKFSADSLRFLLLSSPLLSGEDFALKDKEVGDVARKLSMIWNCYDFFTMYAEVDNWRLPDTASEDALSQKVPVINLSELKNPLDIWIISRLHELEVDVTKFMDEYNIPDAMSGILPFVDDLSNWFVRRSRRRFWKSEDDSDKNDAYRTLYHVLVQLSHVLAPFTPFLSEELYQKMTGGESVHLLDWPTNITVDQKVLNDMSRAREIIEKGLALRMDRDDEFGQIKVRQPLAKLEYSGDKLDDFYEQIIADEVNVKLVNNGKELTLDKNITPELRREGQAREIIRVIQNARKEAGLNVDDRIVVNLTTSDRGLKQSIDEYRDIIATEILATEFLDSPIKSANDKFFETTAKIDDAELKIQLKKGEK
ncbi:class I tRNA ligase family protein [Candidatus Saccharibacteria bacterium]|nr:class I tRNA ligase family protein [Candidatus Saccharibacteria bacterium]